MNKYLVKLKTKLLGFRPQANYTDRATAALNIMLVTHLSVFSVTGAE
jgi:hypothetical protein